MSFVLHLFYQFYIRSYGSDHFPKVVDAVKHMPIPCWNQRKDDLSNFQFQYALDINHGYSRKVTKGKKNHGMNVFTSKEIIF